MSDWGDYEAQKMANLEAELARLRTELAAERAKLARVEEAAREVVYANFDTSDLVRWETAVFAMRHALDGPCEHEWCLLKQKKGTPNEKS